MEPKKAVWTVDPGKGPDVGSKILEVVFMLVRNGVANRIIKIEMKSEIKIVQLWPFTSYKYL